MAIDNNDLSTLRIQNFEALYELQKNAAVPNYSLNVMIKILQIVVDDFDS